MARSIMVAGTMSNVGKSLITAGLCRIFKQDGYKTAPFKSQNMALNSFITQDGLEMGRAQVMQAEAAGIKPDVRMNPILLKPTNDTGSQVIVMGKVRGTMSATDYYKNKKQLVPEIMSAYNSLAKENDIIVLEGAGSPAEINLKDNDIVNMGMAKMAKAPVLLVGDIDRGGVFAQLIGTLELLEKEERAYIRGLIINKFRGDKAILASGIKMLEERAKNKVLGVMPYVHCHIDDEDSLSERFNKKSTVGLVDIAVVRLPRISNFTDFNAFECVDCVSLRYVTHPDEIGDCDIIIIPGTKNTIEDLIWLRERGFEAKIKQHSAKGKAVFGICGGYQMLGREIYDPLGTEHKGSIRGMELLPVTTEFKSDKTRTQVRGRFINTQGIFKALEGQAFQGYEIHMGESTLESGFEPMTDLGEERLDGVNVGNVYGTYVHGIFDCENVVKTIVSAVLKSKCIDDNKVFAFNMADYKERQYDMLAKVLRESLDMEKIYEILQRGVI